MNISRDDWQRRLSERKVTDAEPYRRQLEMLAQTEVKAKNLTGDAVWDNFLSYLQSFRDTTEKQREGFANAINDPKVVDYGRIMEAKVAMAECKGIMDALDGVISLPKDLMEMGAQAKTLLQRMPVA